jgi:uncharacterized membrane protein YphA (DoxX/SURF4 family)
MLQNILLFLLLTGRAFLAAVLVAAGAAKLADRQSFATTLRGLGMPLSQEPLIRGLALIVPLLELLLGLGIVSGLWPAIINGIVLALMCGLSLVVIFALRKKLNVSCRCFGMLSDSQFSGKGLARSLLLSLLALAVFWGGMVDSLRFDAPTFAVALLVAGFILFGLGAAQAAKSIAVIKERMV